MYSIYPVVCKRGDMQFLTRSGNIGNEAHLLFLNLQNAPLMRCRHCHFPRGLGENIWEK